MSFDDRLRTFIVKVRELYETGPHHVAFYNHVTQHLVHDVFPEDQVYSLYVRDEWQEFLNMYNDLAKRSGPAPGAMRTCTVRWPKSLHVQLQDAAEKQGTSLNKLVTQICASAIGFNTSDGGATTCNESPT